MKKIWTDFNNPYPNRPRITEGQVNFFQLVEGEHIILYAEDIQVKAKVMYDSEQSSWCGELVEEFITVSPEIEEARNDGFENGRLFGNWTGRDDLIRKMKSINLDSKLIEEITGVPAEWINRRY